MSNSDAALILSRSASDPIEELLAVYRRHGAVLVRGLIPEDELAQIRAAVTDVVRMEARLAGVDLPEGRAIDIMDLEAIDHGLAATVYDVVNSHPEVYRLSGSPALRNVADVLINGSAVNELVVSGFQLRMDLPNNESELLGWHRDCDYFPQFPTEGLVLWIPLFDIDEVSGGISVVPEAIAVDRLNAVELEKHWPGRRKAHRVFEIDGGETSLAELAEPVRIACKGGDALFFSLASPHRSEPNRSTSARWTLQYRYFSASAVARQKLDRATLARQ